MTTASSPTVSLAARLAARLLPSTASHPTHCGECDGPRDIALDVDQCTECIDAGLVQRLEWRYQNGEGVRPLWRWPGVVEVAREFHPLYLSIGLDFRLGREWWVSVSVAFWHLTIRADL